MRLYIPIAQQWVIERSLRVSLSIRDPKLGQDFSSLALPFHVIATDLETNQTVEVESRDSRDWYLRDMKAYQKELKRVCESMNISFEVLDTATPFDRALRAYFHRRERMF